MYNRQIWKDNVMSNEIMKVQRKDWPQLLVLKLLFYRKSCQVKIHAFCCHSWSITNLNIWGQQCQWKPPLRNEFTFFQSLSQLFKLTSFVKLGKQPWGWIVGTISKFRKRKNILWSLVYFLHKMWKKAFLCHICAVMEKKLPKSVKHV